MPVAVARRSSSFSPEYSSTPSKVGAFATRSPRFHLSREMPHHLRMVEMIAV
jgi:hypothetical protein